MFIFAKITLSLLAGLISTTLWAGNTFGLILLIVNFQNQRDAVMSMNRGGNVFAFASQAQSIVPVRGDLTDYLLVGLVFGVLVFIVGIRSGSYPEIGYRLFTALGGTSLISGGLIMLFEIIFTQEGITSLSITVLLAGAILTGIARAIPIIMAKKNASCGIALGDDYSGQIT